MKVLVVSYHFPPSRAARSLQLGKLLKYVLRRGIHVDAVTVSPECLPSNAVDPDVGRWVEHPNLRLIQVADDGRSRLDAPRRFLGQNFPAWWPRAAAAARDLLLSGSPPYDALVTFAMPIDSHWAGRRIKAGCREIPWLAHFSDPWLGSPYSSVRSRIRRFCFKRVAQSFCRLADIIVSVSEEMTDDFVHRHPEFAHKFRTLHHVFDQEQYPAVEPPSDGPVLLRYLGGFSQRRSPAPLLNALSKARDRGAPLGHLLIELVGNGMKSVEEALNRVHPGIARDRGPVGYIHSLALIRSAHALLLLDADEQFSPFFPSKLADYFGGRRPIIGISPAKSCSTRLIRHAGGLCFTHQQTDELADFVATLCREGPIALPGCRNVTVDRFDASLGAKAFEELIAGLRASGFSESRE